jgi:hypothetical protein
MVKTYPGVTGSITSVDDEEFHFLDIFVDLFQLLLSEKGHISDSEAAPTIKAFLANSGWPRSQQELFCSKLFFLLSDAVDAGKQFNLKEVTKTKRMSVANARLAKEKVTKITDNIILESLKEIWRKVPITYRNANKLAEMVSSKVNQKIQEQQSIHSSLRPLLPDALRKRISSMKKSGKLDSLP